MHPNTLTLGTTPGIGEKVDHHPLDALTFCKPLEVKRNTRFAGRHSQACRPSPVLLPLLTACTRSPHSRPMMSGGP